MHALVITIAKYLVVIPVAVWLLLLWRLPSAQRKQLLVFTALAAVVTAVGVKLATTLHQDPRPFVRDHVQPYFRSATDNGFPSDHTVLSSLLAFVVLRYRKAWGIALAALAVLIGTARVISGVHHGQDIVAGGVLAAVGVAIAWGLQTVIVRMFAKPTQTVEK